MRSSVFDQGCTGPRHHAARDAQIVLRTGGSEPLERIQASIDTVLAAVPPDNLIVLSDVEERIGELPIKDVLYDTPERERRHYPEFALYDTQQSYKRLGKDTRELKGGWALGKFMNLPMKKYLWQLQRNLGAAGLSRKKWFVFVETDTFIDWDNLFELLSHMDASRKLYIGSPVWLPDLQFAHGE